jgi:hypothetical protein
MSKEILIESLEDKSFRVLSKAFSFAYEDNPARTEWPLHPINADFQILNPKHQKGDVYYMAELYLDTEKFDALISLTESLPSFIDTYFSGRCSLHDTLNVYTPEKLESLVDKADILISEIDTLRNNFKNDCK